jgi:hypothetical protein
MQPKPMQPMQPKPKPHKPMICCRTADRSRPPGMVPGGHHLSLNWSTTMNHNTTTTTTTARPGQRRSHCAAGARLTFPFYLESIRAAACRLRSNPCPMPREYAALVDQCAALVDRCRTIAGRASFAPGGSPPDTVGKVAAAIRATIDSPGGVSVVPAYGSTLATMSSALDTLVQSKCHNTSTLPNAADDGSALFLHETPIVTVAADHDAAPGVHGRSVVLWIRHGGHTTATTTARINEALQALGLTLYASKRGESIRVYRHESVPHRIDGMGRKWSPAALVVEDDARRIVLHTMPH